MRRNRQGLRKLSPELVERASDETTSQVVRLMLVFVGTAAFCLLSLASPDVGLLTSGEKLTVPGAGPVSFFGFMLLGPAILIVLRIYLQIYVQHNDRLNSVAERMPVVRAPTLVPLKNPLIRLFGVLTFYWLLPVTMLVFVWKAAVFAPWGSGLLCVTAGVIASHALLPIRGMAMWPTTASLSVGVAILAGGAMLSLGPLRRPFDLYRANLSAASIPGYDLRGAELGGADLRDANLVRTNLSGANLDNASLSGADLSKANLSGAHLQAATLGSGPNVARAAKLLGADLSNADLESANLNYMDLKNVDLRGANLKSARLVEADLRGANLLGTNLSNADLRGADLSDADLRGAALDGQQQLEYACGESAELPPELTLRPCPPNRWR